MPIFQSYSFKLQKNLISLNKHTLCHEETLISYVGGPIVLQYIGPVMVVEPLSDELVPAKSGGYQAAFSSGPSMKQQQLSFFMRVSSPS